jgi:hypothetical protein
MSTNTQTQTRSLDIAGVLVTRHNLLRAYGPSINAGELAYYVAEVLARREHGRAVVVRVYSEHWTEDRAGAWESTWYRVQPLRRCATGGWSPYREQGFYITADHLATVREWFAAAN